MLRFLFALCALFSVALGAGAPRAPLPAAFDPYAVLRVPRDATGDAVRRSYRSALNVLGRAASRDGHGQEPDVAHLELMKSVGLAFRVLTDAAWRAEWDAAHAPDAAATPFPAWDLERDL